MMSRALITAGSIALFGVGCVAELEDAPEVEVTNVAARCPSCNPNGLPPDAWKIAAVELSPSKLGPRGLYTAGRVTPLCEPGTKSTATGFPVCNLAKRWADWADAVPSPERDYRMYLTMYMVKVGARHGAQVKNVKTGVTFSGGFGIAPQVLDSAWDYQTQSLITAGMAVTVDQVANGIEMCMKTKFTPDCPQGYAWHEIAAVGNHFAGQPELVVGGYDAHRPEDSTRVCMGSGVACNTYSATAHYHDALCTYQGPSAQRHPTFCTPAGGGPSFDYAVQVFLPFDPSTLFGTSGGTGVRL